MKNGVLLLLVNISNSCWAMHMVVAPKAPLGVKQIRKMSNRPQNASRDYLQKQIESVGLKKCMQTYKTNKCENPLCCRYAYSYAQNVRIQKEAQERRINFLKQVDEGEGRINFALRVTIAYIHLCVIEEKVVSLYGSNDELADIISHQKDCLRNQYRVICEGNKQE